MSAIDSLLFFCCATHELDVCRFEMRIPREEVAQFEAIIRRVLHDLDPDVIFEICGSYRRGKATCGDIDVLVTHKLFNKPLDGLLDKLVE